MLDSTQAVSQLSDQLFKKYIQYRGLEEGTNFFLGRSSIPTLQKKQLQLDIELKRKQLGRKAPQSRRAEQSALAGGGLWALEKIPNPKTPALLDRRKMYASKAKNWPKTDDIMTIKNFIQNEYKPKGPDFLSQILRKESNVSTKDLLDKIQKNPFDNPINVKRAIKPRDATQLDKIRKGIYAAIKWIK